MKKIGYILGARLRGPVDLGPLGTLAVAGLSTLGSLAVTGVSGFGGVLTITDNTPAPNGLTGSIQTMGGIGVMGQSSFEGAVRIQGILLTNVPCRGLTLWLMVDYGIMPK